jgi:GR25 family glycosyltransferase involved in LPS biosynthesis
MKNLFNFPPVYYINLDFREDRKESIEKTFQDYNISYTRISASNYLGSEQEKWEHLVLDFNEINFPPSVVGCTLSHLEAIETWLNTSNTEIAVIMEDDCDITISDDWRFDWNTLVNNLPFNWDCIQLCMDHSNHLPFFIHPQMKDTGSASGYLINRSYAEKVLRLHKFPEGYCLNNKTGDYLYKDFSSLIDYLITRTGKTYSFPVFTININFLSDHEKDGHMHPRHIPCRNAVYDFWKNKSYQFDLNDFFYYNKPNDYLLYYKINLNDGKKTFSYS